MNFYSASSSSLLRSGAPDTARILCRSFTHHKQLRMKDLPKVPTWRLERDSNPRPFGRKVPNLLMSHHAPTTQSYVYAQLHMYIHVSILDLLRKQNGIYSCVSRPIKKSRYFRFLLN